MGCWRAIAADAAAAAADHCAAGTIARPLLQRCAAIGFGPPGSTRRPADEVVFTTSRASPRPCLPAQRCNPSIGQRLFAVQHAGEAAGDGRGRIRVVAERDRALHAVLVAARGQQTMDRRPETVDHITRSLRRVEAAVEHDLQFDFVGRAFVAREQFVLCCAHRIGCELAIDDPQRRQA